MIFKMHFPSFPLNLFIESFVYMKGFNPIHSIDRFLPDGNTYTVIDLTDEPKFIYDNDTFKEIQTCRKVWFSGIRNNYISIPSGKNSELFIINFKKGKSYPFVQIPLNELTDCVVDAELVMTNEILNLRETLLAIESIDQKFITVEQHLIKHRLEKLIVNPFVDFAVNSILQSPNQVSIHSLSNKVGYSQKHLIKIFKEHVGVTPKAFLKIIRFQKAIEELEITKTANWTKIAFDSGYYDQAHFINDFKKYSGFTPNHYLNTKGEFTNYVPAG